MTVFAYLSQTVQPGIGHASFGNRGRAEGIFFLLINPQL
jgi:hypothetical protein